MHIPFSREMGPDDWKKALQYLTPGGSEFTEVGECYDYLFVKNREQTYRNRDLVVENKKLRARMNRYVKAFANDRLRERFICTAETFLVSWIITGSWEVGGIISGILFFTKIATYFMHERLWENVKWGKKV